MTKDEILLAHQEYLFPSVFHYYREPLVIARAKDQYVWDADGNQYLDFFGGIVTISVGHCNERVNAQGARAGRHAAARLDGVRHRAAGGAGEEDRRRSRPGGRLTKSFFTNSGTEANETAILAARCYTGASEIVALRHSYHGRSSLAMALTGHGAWRLAAPPQPGIVHAHNAYCYRCPFGLTYPDCDVRVRAATWRS